MSTVKIRLSLLTFAALISASAIAQTPGSEAAPAKLSGHAAELKKKALAGDTKAQLRLGIAFEFGEGVGRNLDEAAHWYRIAADRGDPIAQTNLAYLYENGGDGFRDPSEAAKWYMRAAVSGFARAEFNLGILYLQGTGVERSDEEAAHWIGQAADAGCPSALAALGYLYANGKGVPRDPRKALDLIQKSARKNDANSCARFGSQPPDSVIAERRSRNQGWNTNGDVW
jgi:TPR repeat protein